MATQPTQKIEELKDRITDLEQEKRLLEQEVTKYRRLYEQSHHRLEGALMAIQHVANPMLDPKRAFKAL